MNKKMIAFTLLLLLGGALWASTGMPWDNSLKKMITVARGIAGVVIVLGLIFTAVRFSSGDIKGSMIGLGSAIFGGIIVVNAESIVSAFTGSSTGWLG
jgi:type IV secretory pathway VirB2 component (pilin)